MTADRSGAPLRFATFPAPNMLPVYRFLADQIAHRLGFPVQLVVGSSFDQFDQGEADYGVICGLPYVWLADRRPPSVAPLAAPVLAGDRYAGRPIYFSDVIPPRQPNHPPGGAGGPVLGPQRARLPLRPHHHPLQLGPTRSSARVPGPGG
jgi:hypothetical protein